MFLVGFLGWGHLENMHLAVDVANEKEAIAEFLEECKRGNSELWSESTYAGWEPDRAENNILVYELKESMWEPVPVDPVPVEYRKVKKTRTKGKK